MQPMVFVRVTKLKKTPVVALNDARKTFCEDTAVSAHTDWSVSRTAFKPEKRVDADENARQVVCSDAQFLGLVCKHNILYIKKNTLLFIEC